jgi:hypothetical protein
MELLVSASPGLSHWTAFHYRQTDICIWMHIYTSSPTDSSLRVPTPVDGPGPSGLLDGGEMCSTKSVHFYMDSMTILIG